MPILLEWYIICLKRKNDLMPLKGIFYMLYDLKNKMCKYLLNITLCFVVFASFSSLEAARNQESFQWRNSAKSLTTFKPGDAAQILIWDLSQTREGIRTLDLSNKFSISPEGNVVLPMIGEVNLKGLTPYEASQLLQEKYKAYMHNPYVHVRPMIRLTLQGAFNKPGSYLIDPDNSLWDLIAEAGGPNGGCDLEGMWVERGGKIVMESLLKSFEEGYSLEEIGIESGDQILAPTRRTWNFQTLITMVNLLGTFVLIYIRLKDGY